MKLPVALTSARCLTLRAPGRLHCGFLDPSGTLGRRFGSIGLMIEGFETVLSLRASTGHAVIAATSDTRAEVERASAHLHVLRQRTGCRQPLQLSLLEVLPPHTGLGSGTQLALAIGRAFACWHGLDLSTHTLAQWLNRGLRSGVGIAGFDQGGLLVDGGPCNDAAPAALLSRVELPAAWHIIVVTDERHRGLSGEAEKRAIATLTELPQAHAAEICHQTLMRVLPGAASDDFASFALGLNHIQRLLGAHFAPAQGGSAYTSPAVGRLAERMRDLGAHGIGQSSWGPTGFAFVEDQAAADRLYHSLVEEAKADGLDILIAQGRNTGASIHTA